VPEPAIAEIIRGRMTAAPPPGTVVFLFGLRVNDWGAVRDWLPLWRSLDRMLRELERRPESGCLWSTRVRDGREITVIQYWRDMDALMTYAQNKAFLHANAWRRFNLGVGDRGTVGIWHEAYVIDPETPGHLHAIYRDIPERGLAAATGIIPAHHEPRRG